MIPDSFTVQGVVWRVRWRDPEDPTWKQEQSWGMTFFQVDGPEIHIDAGLRSDPTKLREIWLHELLHAVFPTLKRVDSKLEEKIVDRIAPMLASILNQSGWPAV